MHNRRRLNWRHLAVLALLALAVVAAPVWQMMLVLAATSLVLAGLASWIGQPSRLLLVAGGALVLAAALVAFAHAALVSVLHALASAWQPLLFFVVLMGGLFLWLRSLLPKGRH
jgi:hypothetical protein